MSGSVCMRCRLAMRRAVYQHSQYRNISSTSRRLQGDAAIPKSSDELEAFIRETHKQNPKANLTPLNSSSALSPNHTQDYVTSDERLRSSATQTPSNEIDELLSKPRWSVRSLLPPANPPINSEITPEKLHHLLRLSALPQPKDAEEEASMLETLHAQLHFVRDIQSVDTEGVEPLVGIRDETKAGLEQEMISLDSPEIINALENEVVQGSNKRPRRRRDVKVDTQDAEKWNVLGTAGRTEGRYFVVNSGKAEQASE
ncbi:hypothetical protein BP6252_03485 [Coleophoma cylindrospora]|uniref:Glutamyl-tRNA amidotransferase complex subunit Gta3 domain-containing protein n=1 Tax=Coleophoma cylindrospora TaxID=1849047 RepID=A0A3D8S7T5_9HELO|nr:hypothetical protein BP6252_03485 [Coleophoma cylindrospora]